MGPPARRGVHRAGGRGRRRQRLGAGPLPHGGAARDRPALRDAWRRRRASCAAWQASPSRGLLLTGDVETMAALYRANPTVVHRINLGGVHHRPGRRERLPYLYLTDEELRCLVALEAEGAEITAQDLPTTSPVALRAIA